MGMLNKSGAQAGFERCSGLPAALKEEFVRESTKCPSEVIIPTPVSELYEHIFLGGKWDEPWGEPWGERWGDEQLNEDTSVLGIPPVMKHKVDKQSNQLCVSKQMVNRCPKSKPLSIRKKSVEFACIAQPSVKAGSLLRSVPCLVSLSCRRSLSCQPFSAEKSMRQWNAAPNCQSRKRFPPNVGVHFVPTHVADCVVVEINQ